MKFSAALVACLAGFAVATGQTFHERRLANVGNATFAVKFAEGNVDNSGVFRETIHGTPADLAQFSSGLTMSQLKQILGNSWGLPFYFTFLDNTSNQQIGYLSGYFTTSGGVTIDSTSQIPDGGNIPIIQKQPSTAPPVITVTATPPQSASIIAAGKLTDKDLHDLLGGDYGKPFRIVLTGSTGSQIGFVSGSFTSRGVKFDPTSNIPKTDSASGNGSGANGSGSGANGSGSGSTGSGSGSTGSGNGSGSTSTGSGNGSGSTGSGSTSSGSTGAGSTGSGSTGSGSTGAGSTGSGSTGSGSTGAGSTGSGSTGAGGTGSGSTGSGSTGSGSMGSGSTSSGSTGAGSTGSGSTSSGSTSSGSTGSSSGQTQNADGTYGDPNKPNAGTLSIGTGSKTDAQNKLNNLSYQDILTSVGGKYGPFDITFQNADGTLKGYIKGYIDPKSYSYQWSYTYTS